LIGSFYRIKFFFISVIGFNPIKHFYSKWFSFLMSSFKGLK
jgi:hypothetical protein